LKKEDFIVFNKLTKTLLSKRLSHKIKLKRALSIILSHTKCNRGSIMLKNNDTLEIVASTNAKLIGVSTPLDDTRSPAVKAFKELKILNLKTDCSKKQYKNFTTFLITPIKVNNDAYGVINLTEKDNDQDFTDKDTKFISKFVESISILIENLYLTSELENKNSKLTTTLDELKKTQKFRDELSNMIIHDLKSPLSEIIANLDILYRDSYVKDNLFDVVDAGIKGAQDMMSMIQNLVDIYKIEQNNLILNKNLEDINNLLQETVHKLYSLIIEKKQKLYLNLDKSIPLTNIDKLLILRIFYNLLNNAIKYSPIKKSIYILTQKIDNNILIEIKNTGVGIANNQLTKIFDKFYSIQRGQDNSGLGLTFVKLAVETHNGIIKVFSKKDLWTKFQIFLPIEEDKNVLDQKILDLTL